MADIGQQNSSINTRNIVCLRRIIYNGKGRQIKSLEFAAG